ncbi:MAG: hypothetical protein LR008_00875 [Candidatus Pacebacteria bacterium]|nr:hypothetical protein [Candidatus Paceibacterota bacterium]
MTNTQTSEPSKIKTIALLIVVVVAAYFLVTTLVNNKFSEIEDSVMVQVYDQEELLKAIVKIVYADSTDLKIESVITDCNTSERTQFHDSLDRLNQNLSIQELKELELLFSRCGSFDSESKLILIARLTREVEVYETYVSTLSVITGGDVYSEFSVDKWKGLAAEEQRQALLYSNLVNLQGEIITSLLSGKDQASPEINKILQEVSEVKGNLIVLNQQTEKVRTELVPIQN